MKPQDIIVSSIARILQNRLRAGLSSLGILIGIASVLCMIAIGDGAKKIIAEDIKKLGGSNQVRFSTRTTIWKRGRPHPTKERYTLADAQAIEGDCLDVLFVLPKNDINRAFLTSQDGSQSMPILEGVTEDYIFGMHWQLQEGRFISQKDVQNEKQVCVLGANIANELFGEVSPLGHEVKVRYYWRQTPVRMQVVGVMKSKGNVLSSWRSLDNTVCVPLTTLQQRLSGIRYVEDLIVFFKETADVHNVIDSVRHVLHKRHRGQTDFTQYWIPKYNLRRLEHIEKVIKIALGSIAGFSLIVSGIGIMNICLVSVGEKTREIGLCKSVGAKRIDIFWQFLSESIFLCFCGGILGVGCGWFAAHSMARLAVRIVPIVDEWPVVLSVQWMLISVIFSIFMGVVFGVYPAIRAAWMSPIDALRSDT